VLEEMIASFGIADALKVKQVERTTNHDVKAVEYVLKEAFARHPELAKVGCWTWIESILGFRARARSALECVLKVAFAQHSELAKVGPPLASVQPLPQPLKQAQRRSSMC